MNGKEVDDIVMETKIFLQILKSSDWGISERELQ